MGNTGDLASETGEEEKTPGIAERGNSNVFAQGSVIRVLRVLFFYGGIGFSRAPELDRANDVRLAGWGLERRLLLMGMIDF